VPSDDHRLELSRPDVVVDSVEAGAASDAARERTDA
jgi:hypothetical protein